MMGYPYGAKNRRLWFRELRFDFIMEGVCASAKLATPVLNPNNPDRVLE